MSERNITEPFEVILEIENKCKNIGRKERKERKEGNVLFNNALNTFYLRLYGVGDVTYDVKCSWNYVKRRNSRYKNNFTSVHHTK